MDIYANSVGLGPLADIKSPLNDKCSYVTTNYIGYRVSRFRTHYSKNTNYY